MKNSLSKILLASALFIIIISAKFSFSQTTQIDLEVGKTYRIVLFDDNEISGKVIALDSVSVKIKSETGEVIMVVRDNILYVSSDLTPQKYKFSLSLLGGIAVHSGDNHYSYGYYSPNGRSKPAPHFDLTGIYYFSDTKGIKIDLSYSYFKANYDDYIIYSYSEYPPSYSGGDITYIAFKPNFIIGTLKPAERIFAYGSFGVGFNYTSVSERREQWYDSYDSTYRTAISPPTSNVNLMFSLGGGAGYRISKNLGIHAELEYNMMVDGNYFFLFGGRGYFPVRIGVTYMLF